MDHSPGLFGAIECDFLSVVDAVGQMQVPVEVFDILDEVSDGDFEFGQRDVAVDPRDDHSLVDSDNRRRSAKASESWSGDLSVLGAGTGHQRVSHGQPDTWSLRGAVETGGEYV